jgi:hypothetical protein
VREGLKAKRRSRRKMAADDADTENPGRPRRNDLLPLLKIEPCGIDELKPHTRKLRKSDLAHIQEIANAISTLGFNVPLLIGKDNVVLDGESRLAAAKWLGLSSVPCIRVDHLNETEQRLLRLAVNRLGEKGAWDVGELKAEFEELIIADAPIEITGFGLDEIDDITTADDDDVACEANESAALPGGSAIAQVGDLFLLGSHRVICGNAADPDLVTRLMQSDVARMVLTDAPSPSSVAIAEQVATSDPPKDGIATGHISDAQCLEFSRNWMKAILPHLVDGGLLGTFLDWRDLPLANAAATDLGLIPVDLIVWATANAAAGGLYRSDHRLLPFFKKGSAAHVNNSSKGTRVTCL